MATLSTFSNFKPTEEVIEQVETPIETVETPLVETPIETIVETPVIEPTEKVNTNESTFDLGLDETPTIVETPISEKPHVNTSTGWKEILKNIDKKEVAQFLGINEFALELNEHISRGGVAADYINAKGVDWSKVPDADIVLTEMKKEFPNATQAQLERLFNKKYNQTELAEDEDKEDGLLIMSADARKLREKMIAEQGRFKLPEATIPIAAKTQQEVDAQQRQAQEQAIAERQNVIKFYEENEATKNLMTSKRVAVDLGEIGSFNFKIDKPELITKLLTDAEMWAKVTSTSQGEPDVQKQQMIGLFAANPKKFAMELVNYGKSLGEMKLVEEGQNATKPTGRVATMVDEKPTYSLKKGAV